MPAISQAAHSKSIWNTKSSGTYQPIMSNPVISMPTSKQHVIWWVLPILRYSRPSPSNRSTCFLWLSQCSFLPIFFVLASEGLATLGQPCGKASWMDPWHSPPYQQHPWPLTRENLVHQNRHLVRIQQYMHQGRRLLESCFQNSFWSMNPWSCILDSPTPLPPSVALWRKCYDQYTTNTQAKYTNTLMTSWWPQ